MLLEGAAGSVGLRGSVTGRRGDDLRTPIGDLFNSGLEAVNAAGAMGLRGTWGHGQLDIVHRSERVEIHEDPADDPLATPYQRITEDRVRADVGLPMGAARVELRFGYERNRRREFEERTATDVALGLTSTTLTGEAHLHHTALAGWDGILGVSLLRNTVDVFGDEALVPASRYVDFGAFLFEQRELGDSLWQLSGGLRFDARRLGGREPGAGRDRPGAGVHRVLGAVRRSVAPPFSPPNRPPPACRSGPRKQVSQAATTSKRHAVSGLTLESAPGFTILLA